MSEFTLTAKQIARNYQTLRTIINEQFPTRKDALNRMYDDLDSDDMRVQMAPASSMEFFHNAIPGGYVDHVLRVYEFTVVQYELWQKMGMKLDNFTLEELLFAAIHHDLGKLGLPGVGKEYYQPNDSKWHRDNQGKIYKANPNVPWMKTHDVTLYLLNHYNVPYSVNEMLGMRLTDGMFEESNKQYLSGFDLSSKLRNTMPYILHHADIMAFRFEFERWATASEKFNLNAIGQVPQIKSQVKEEKPVFGLDAFEKMFGEK